MFTEPELSFRARSERFAEGFLRDHLGSLECRVRNDHAKCSGPTNAIPMATTVLIANCVMPLRMLIPFMVRYEVCPCGYKYSALRNQPVMHFTAWKNFCLPGGAAVQLPMDRHWSPSSIADWRWHR